MKRRIQASGVRLQEKRWRLEILISVAKMQVLRHSGGPLLSVSQPRNNLFDQCVRVTLAFGDLSRVTRHCRFVQFLAQQALEEGIAQHLDQALAPVVGDLLLHEVVLRQELLVARDSRCDFGYSSAVAGDSLHYRWNPAVTARGQRLHGADLALDAFGALA